MYDNEANKHKENSSTYDNEGEENTSSTSKNKGNHVMVMLLCMNAAYTSYTNFMRNCEHQMLYTPVRWNKLWQNKNMNMKTCDNVLSFNIRTKKTSCGFGK